MLKTMSNKIYELSKSEFESLIKSCHNIKEVLFKLGLTSIGNSWGYSLVKKRMQELKLSGADFIGKSAMIQSNASDIKSDQKLFVNNSTSPRCVIRRRIIENNLIDYKCSCCGLTEWQGRQISLELDHINGINNDNRLENLRFLCPNCHSQTVTYGSKNLNSAYKNTKVDCISDDLRKSIIEKYKQLRSIKKVKEVLKIKASIISEVIKEAGINKNSNQKYVIRFDLEDNEISRYGSINEACQELINNNELRTNSIKTARNTFLRNYKKIWLNSKWKILDSVEYD